MEFKVFKCECGYQVITPVENPKCDDCGKNMVPMKKESKEYKKFDSEVKKALRL